MITEVERINGIVDDFLLLSRPGDMKMESQKIEDIVEETMRLFQSNAEDIGIEIVLVKEADLPPVFCEPNQLKQVLINMIKNGMEAMSQGGRITIELTYPLKDYLQIRICDQGEGIDPEALERIGEPFYTTKENGTGLGLMVSCRIIEYHHGKLNVYSKKDEGSTFEILLPLDPGKSDPVHKKRIMQASSVKFIPNSAYCYNIFRVCRVGFYFLRRLLTCTIKVRGSPRLSTLHTFSNNSSIRNT
ncbi:ATP-binding protein [Paenibacillus larvae]|nr:ATP-binding protein [Paenibacillus larvae]MDT2259491.1 ATP-binding protein [Paenibacillus larvae]